jgi:hypothetical protein
MPLHINLHTTTRNLKGRQLHLVEVERRRHVSAVERLDMWRKSAIRSKMIYRRRLNALKETCSLYVDPLIISPSKSKLLRPCCLIVHRTNG